MNRNVYSACDISMQDLNKGKSFRFSDWNMQTLYLNDSYIQDFVSYKGSLYACLQSNTNVTPDNDIYWQLVISGVEGKKGDKGDQGIIFTPFVSSDGTLTWTNDGGLENPNPVNIRGPKGEDSTVPGPRGLKGDKGDSIIGPKGDKGDQGIGLEFSWDGTKLGIRKEGEIEFVYVDLKGDPGPRGNRGIQGIQGIQGEKGSKGDSLNIRVSDPDEDGKLHLEKRYNDTEDWEKFFDLSLMQGPKGDSIIIERDLNGDVYYRYESEPSSANRLLIYKDEIRGPKGDTIARTYVGDDGYLYIQTSGENVPRRAGYVRGDRGEDGREIVLRVYSGPSIEGDYSRWGTHLQWKYAGDEYKLWSNLIRIDDLMNIALAGLKIEYDIVKAIDDNGVEVKYEQVTLSSNRVEFDENGNLVILDKIANLSSFKVPTKIHLMDVKYLEDDNTIRFIFDTAIGERIIDIDCDQFFKAGNGITISDGNVINVNVATDSDKLADNSHILTVDKEGLRVRGLKDKIVKEINLIKTDTGNDTHIYSYEFVAQDGTVYPFEIPNFVEWNTDEENVRQILLRNTNDKITGWDINKIVRDLIYIDTENLINVGDTNTSVNLQGNKTRPYYNKEELSLLSDLLSEIAGLHFEKEDVPPESDFAARYFLADKNNNILGDVTINVLKDKFLKNVTYNEETYTFTFEFWVNDDPEGESSIQTVSFDLQELVQALEDKITDLDEKLTQQLAEETQARIEADEALQENVDDILATFNTLPDTLVSQLAQPVITSESISIDSKIVTRTGLEYGDPVDNLVELPAATQENAGCMTATDKSKLDDLSITYNSNMPDELALPEDIFGIPAGTIAAELKKLTWAQILDNMMFPTVQPTITNPSASISFKNGFTSNGIYEAGAPAPQKDVNFNTSFNRGRATVVGQPNKYRAGELNVEQSFVYCGSTASPDSEFPTTIPLGSSLSYRYRAYHGEGDTLLDNKGGIATVNPNPLPAGYITSGAISVSGTYPYFCNGQSASTSSKDNNLPETVTPNTKLPLVSWNTTLIGAKFASEANAGIRLVFEYPSAKKVTKVEFFNTVSGAWEAFTAYTTSESGTKSVQGNDVAYSQLTTTGSLSGALQLRFTVANS